MTGQRRSQPAAGNSPKTEGNSSRSSPRACAVKVARRTSPPSQRTCSVVAGAAEALVHQYRSVEAPRCAFARRPDPFNAAETISCDAPAHVHRTVNGREASRPRWEGLFECFRKDIHATLKRMLHLKKLGNFCEQKTLIMSASPCARARDRPPNHELCGVLRASCQPAFAGARKANESYRSSVEAWRLT